MNEELRADFDGLKEDLERLMAKLEAVTHKVGKVDTWRSSVGMPRPGGSFEACQNIYISLSEVSSDIVKVSYQLQFLDAPKPPFPLPPAGPASS